MYPVSKESEQVFFIYMKADIFGKCFLISLNYMKLRGVVIMQKFVILCTST
jgi:hypothetical protein